jgi:tetratricopeptide (TPR) repeat protein
LKNNIAEAQRQVAKAVMIAPTYSDAIAFRGVLAMQQGDLTSAGNDFQQAIQYDNSNSLAYVAMGSLYNTEGKFDDAIREINCAFAIDPNSWKAHFEMSRADLGKSQFDGALQEATRAEQLIGRDFAPLHLLKGQTLLAMRMYSGAAEELQKFLNNEKNPELTAQAKEQLEEAKSLAAGEK